MNLYLYPKMRIRVSVILFILVGVLFFQPTVQAQSAGDSLYNLGFLDQAIDEYTAEFNAEKNSVQPNLEHAMQLMTSLGSVCEDAGRLDEALEWYLMYKRFAEKYNPLEIGDALNLIGNVWFRLGDFSTAIEYYFKSLYFSQIIDDQLAISSASNNIGNVYFSLDQYEDADKYYQNSIRIKLVLKDYSELPSCLINAGNVKMILEDYDHAEEYFRRALQISISQGNQFRGLSAMASLGILFERTAQNDSAYHWFEAALEIMDKDQLSIEYIMTLRGLGALELGKRNYQFSINYLEKALELSQGAGLNDIISDILELLAEACEKAGFFKESTNYYKQLNAINDSLFDTELSEKLSQNESSYENLLKKKTIEMQQLEIESGREINRFLIWLSIIITVSLFTISIFIVRIFRNRNKYQKKILEGRIHEVRLQALRAQINPHFVSNALNSIQNFFINGDLEQATDYLADFGHLIRMVLDNSNSSYIRLSDEVAFLKLYIKLEQLRMNGHFRYEVSFDKILFERNPLVPPLIVQPYVENAIWHGLSHREDGGMLKVHYSELGEDIKVTIEDNGIGMEKSKELYLQYSKKRKSYAMSINKERVKLFKEYFDRDLSTKIHDLCTEELCGTMVEIIIPGIERSE